MSEKVNDTWKMVTLSFSVQAKGQLQLVGIFPLLEVAFLSLSVVVMGWGGCSSRSLLLPWDALDWMVANLKLVDRAPQCGGGFLMHQIELHG